MHSIDLETWPRRAHFELYKDFDSPHFNICANVDLTAFYPWVKSSGSSFTIAVIYLIARVANELPAFRLRIHGDQVVEHAVVHPSSTILTSADVFSFLTVAYCQDFSEFAGRAAEQIEALKRNPSIEDPPESDDLLFMTPIPWVSFTGFMHPLHLSPPDSVPRFAWGKYFREADRLKMPFSVQVHHALMDGLHVGRCFERLQAYLDRPESISATSV